MQWVADNWLLVLLIGGGIVAYLYFRGRGGHGGGLGGHGGGHGGGFLGGFGGHGGSHGGGFLGGFGGHGGSRGGGHGGGRSYGHHHHNDNDQAAQTSGASDGEEGTDDPKDRAGTARTRKKGC